MQDFSSKAECHPAAVRAYLTEREVAQRLSVSIKWLQKMRLSGGGIAFSKFGSNVRYPIVSVLEFETAAVRRSTSDHGRQVI